MPAKTPQSERVQGSIKQHNVQHVWSITEWKIGYCITQKEYPEPPDIPTNKTVCLLLAGTQNLHKTTLQPLEVFSEKYIERLL